MKKEELIEKIKVFIERRNALQSEKDNLDKEVLKFLNQNDYSLTKIAYAIGTTYLSLANGIIATNAIERMSAILEGDQTLYKKVKRGKSKAEVI